MTRADRVRSTPRTDSSLQQPMFPPIAEASDSTIHQCPPADRTDEKPPGGDPIQFKSLAEAEAWLLSQGFRLVDGTCKWTNDAGDDAGVYSIDGYWGEVRAGASKSIGARLKRNIYPARAFGE